MGVGSRAGPVGVESTCLRRRRLFRPGKRRKIHAHMRACVGGVLEARTTGVRGAWKLLMHGGRRRSIPIVRASRYIRRTYSRRYNRVCRRYTCVRLRMRQYSCPIAHAIAYSVGITVPVWMSGIGLLAWGRISRSREASKRHVSVSLQNEAALTKRPRLGS